MFYLVIDMYFINFLASYFPLLYNMQLEHNSNTVRMEALHHFADNPLNMLLIRLMSRCNILFGPLFERGINSNNLKAIFFSNEKY